MCTNPRHNTGIIRKIRSKRGKKKVRKIQVKPLRKQRWRDNDRYTEGGADEPTSLPCPAFNIMCRSPAKPSIVFWEKKLFPSTLPEAVWLYLPLLLHTTQAAPSIHAIPRPGEWIHSDIAWLQQAIGWILYFSHLFVCKHEIHPPNCAQQHTRLCQMRQKSCTVWSFCFQQLQKCSCRRKFLKVLFILSFSLFANPKVTN